jgi:hypothetical protein
MAFDKLQYTYNIGPVPTNVILATQFFINTLRDSLKGSYNKDILPRCLVEGENRTFLDYDKIKLYYIIKHCLNKILSIFSSKCYYSSAVFLNLAIASFPVFSFLTLVLDFYKFLT